MKIAIDANELTIAGTTGVKVYVQEIVDALSKLDVKNEYILYAKCRNEALSRSFELENKNFELKIVKSSFPFWTYTKFPMQLKKDEPDILFMPIQSVPFFKKPKNIKIVVTVHDLAFLMFSDYFTFKDRFFLKLHTKRAVMMADEIIVPSEATKNDIIKFYKIDESKITVVYHGITFHEKNKLCHSREDRNPGFDSKDQFMENDANYSPELPETNRKNLDNKNESAAKNFQPYLLFVGVIQPRKNIIRLIEAFEIVKVENQELKLVIVGKRGWQADAIYKRAKESHFAKDIIFSGGVDDEYLCSLYINAMVFILPSLYEGFGMPVLEAMNYGVPCVVGNNSSLAEISGDSALLVDSNDSSDIAKKITMLCNDENLRHEFSRKGAERLENFNWKKSAKQTLEVFESVN
ncbi:MAG: glycosyltransferase family 4 protein [Candidatus Pacebacteria bacterium]|nr:glycosyltransferase family 4 protein [Candidatus Paceibacterota bacterium]